MARALCMHQKDNVATALADIHTGDEVSVEGMTRGGRLVAAEPIPFGHKIALVPIPTRGKIRKYGEVIGAATQAISAGAHVHVHNLKSMRR